MRLPTSLARPATRAGVLVTLSFLLWGSWGLTHRFVPLFGGVSGRFSDHLSHMNAARVFTQCGLCLWQRPVEQFMRRYTVEEQRQLPEELRNHVPPGFDVFVRPGWPLDKPLLLNWPFLPRPYPPGALVISAPAALAYHFTPLSFSGAGRLLGLIYLACAHVGFFFLLRGRLEGQDRVPASGLFGGVILYAASIHWALDGFYDVALITPLVLCGHFLTQRRGLAALVCYCAATFIHYRAYFFAPLSLLALGLIIKDWKQLRWGARQWGAVAAIVVLGGLSLYTFWLISPWLARFPDNNVLHAPLGPAPMQLLLMGAVAAGVLLSARAWMDVVLMLWLLGMHLSIRQMYEWHTIALLMWWVLPVWNVRAELVPRVRDVRLLLVLLVAALFYNQPLLSMLFWG